MRHLINIFRNIIPKRLPSKAGVKPSHHPFYTRPLIYTKLRMDNQQQLTLYKAMDLAG